jgi:hypothetical protein
MVPIPNDNLLHFAGTNEGSVAVFDDVCVVEMGV